MQTYKVAGTHVAHQNIDDEVVVVDLLEGLYFSITGGGTVIWEHLVNGHSREQIVQHMSSAYNTNEAELEIAVDKFLQQLLDESLLAKSEASPTTLPQTSGSVEKLKFEPVTFEKYSDMDRALMIDPVHDTDDSGWPNLPVGATEGAGGNQV